MSLLASYHTTGQSTLLYIQKLHTGKRTPRIRKTLFKEFLSLNVEEKKKPFESSFICFIRKH